MTMVPAENCLPKQHQLPHGGGFYGYCGSNYGESFGLMSRVHGYDFHTTEACLGIGSDRMAEDESRANSLNEAAASNSKDNNNNNQEQEQERDEGWLRLSIGAQAQAQATRHDRNELDPTARAGGLIELDLLPGSSSQSQQARPLGLASMFHHMPEFSFRSPQQPPHLMHSFSTPLFFQQHQQGSGIGSFPYHGELSSSFRLIQQNMAAPSTASSSNSFVPLGSYFARPFPVQPEMDVAGASSDFRIIDPPRRPHSGIWFLLQASQNQAKEPFLPQIPKSFLRIKDREMTVRLLIKYVINKLRLDSESEVEITCRGQQLLPHLTLLQVRDEIWSSRDAVTLLPHTLTHDHLMILHYGRSPN